MKKLKMTTKAMGALLFSVLLLPSCSDMDEYFETPDWIQGSIYEKLQADGQYSQFLRGADMAGYKPILDGKAILTVMAPDDNAMQQYLQSAYGVQSIDEISIDEARKLIGFHMLYYSYDREKLINFRPLEGDGATDEQKAVKAGLYYKYRTRSQDPVVLEDDTAYVYHPERFIPVFSYMMFRTKGIDAQKNYTYFYPETGWTADNSFQAANANVLNADAKDNVAKNGYIYKVDRVLRPLETIYNELKNSGKYGRFVSFYDQYKTYVKSTELTRDFATTDEQKSQGLYTVNFGSLPTIANEWPTDDYRFMSTLAHKSYSIFAPTNAAIDDFFEDYWRVGGYSSLDEVPTSQMQTLLMHCIYQQRDGTKDQTMIFPEEIENGSIQDESGNVITFDTSEVPQADRIICSNGVLYGCSVLTPPSMFNSVTGPAYQYKKYSTFGAMLSSTASNGAGLDGTLSTNSINFITLYPDNDQLANSEMGITVSKTTPATIMKQEITDEEPVTLGASIVQNYANSHAVMATDGNTVLPTGNTRPAVYATMQGSPLKVYWYVKNGKITNSIQYLSTLKYAANQATEADIWADFHPLDYRGDVDGWSNGHAYSYDNLLFRGNYKASEAFYTLATDNSTDQTSQFYGWYSLLRAGNFISAGNVSFMTESSLMFVPTTEAITKAIVDGRIPGVSVEAGTTASDADFFSKVTVTSQTELRYYLVRYFVPLSTAVITNYPYLGWGEITTGLEYGGLETLQVMDDSGDIPVVGKSYALNIYDDGSALSVDTRDLQTGATSNRVNMIADYDYLPLIFSDGVVYFLEDVL